VSLHLQRHYDVYGTILIAPTAEDSGLMHYLFRNDNEHRQCAIQKGGRDPGRGEVDWSEVKINFFSLYLNIC